MDRISILYEQHTLDFRISVQNFQGVMYETTRMSLPEFERTEG